MTARKTFALAAALLVALNALPLAVGPGLHSFADFARVASLASDNAPTPAANNAGNLASR